LYEFIAIKDELMKNRGKLQIMPHDQKTGMIDRHHLNGHRSLVIWFTGLSGSGRSTLANMLERYLQEREIHTFILDGDHVGKGLNRDLDFSDARSQ
jgi:adenylylsulfate kinase